MFQVVFPGTALSSVKSNLIDSSLANLSGIQERINKIKISYLVGKLVISGANICLLRNRTSITILLHNNLIDRRTTFF